MTKLLRVGWPGLNKDTLFNLPVHKILSTSALSYPSSNNWEVILLSFPKSFQDLRKDGSFPIIGFNFILFLRLHGHCTDTMTCVILKEHFT